MATILGSRIRSRPVTRGASTKERSRASARGRTTVFARYSAVIKTTVTMTASNFESRRDVATSGIPGHRSTLMLFSPAVLPSDE